MLPGDLFRSQPTISTDRLRLEPLGPQHFEGSWSTLQDEDAMRLTGTQTAFSENDVHRWLASLSAQHDRADWAVIRLEDGAHIGEVVLNDLDAQNESVNLRIVLAGERARGQGFGTEAVMAALAYAFGTAGLHRVYLDVYSFNPAARRVYEKCGFVIEGRQRHTLHWNGEWMDSVLMGVLASDPRPAARAVMA